MASVSVVIAAYNEAAHIERCLRSVADQSTPAGELILVDDGSRDATGEIAERLGVEVLRTNHRGAAAARNAGAARAEGEILAFLDADMAWDPGYLAAITRPMTEEGATGSFTREIYLGNPESDWARSYCRIRRLGTDLLLPPDFPEHSANYRAIWRSDFERVGGYEDVGYGEDMTLAPKLGRLAVAAPGAKVMHFNPASLSEIYSNGRWIGRGHDICEVPHPWRDNSPWRAVSKGISEMREGAGPTIVPARLAYSVGVMAGMCHRALWPKRHWK